jgi:hypothetical protein
MPVALRLGLGLNIQDHARAFRRHKLASIETRHNPGLLFRRRRAKVSIVLKTTRAEWDLPTGSQISIASGTVLHGVNVL